MFEQTLVVIICVIILSLPFCVWFGLNSLRDIIKREIKDEVKRQLGETKWKQY